MPGVFSANKVIFQISISFHSIEYMYFRNIMYAIIVIYMNCKLISNSHPVRPVLKIFFAQNYFVQKFSTTKFIKWQYKYIDGHIFQ